MRKRKEREREREREMLVFWFPRRKCIELSRSKALCESDDLIERETDEVTSTYTNDELPDESITTARFCRVSSRFISICDSFVFVVVVFRYRYYCYCYSRYSRSRTRNLNRKNRKNPKSPTTRMRMRMRMRMRKRSLFSLFLSLAPSLSVLACRRLTRLSRCS